MVSIAYADCNCNHYIFKGQLERSRFQAKNPTDWKIYLTVGSLWGIWHAPYYLVFLPEADVQTVLPISRAIFFIVSITIWPKPGMKKENNAGTPCVLL